MVLAAAVVPSLRKKKPRSVVGVDGVAVLCRWSRKRVVESAAMAAPTPNKVARSGNLNMKEELGATAQSNKCLPCKCIGDCHCVAGVL